MKNYILFGSLFTVASILGFDFVLFPKITDLIGDIALQSPGLIEMLRMKMIYFSVSYIIAICLINLFIYNKLKSFDDEKQKMESILKINPQDKFILSKIDLAKNKGKFYSDLLDGVIKMEAGFAVSGMLYLIIVPIWEIAFKQIN